IDGLVSTRTRVVERMLGISAGDVLTSSGLRRAERRLADLPAGSSTRVSYEPVGAGKAEVRAVVAERPFLPHDVWAFGALGLSAVAGRSVGVTTGSLTGGGESVDASWRFWPHRPAVAVALRSPATFGGVWAARAFGEEQPFTDSTVHTVRRQGGRLSVENWVTSFARVSVRGGLDRWMRVDDSIDDSSRLAPTAGGTLRLVSNANRADIRLEVDGWRGP